MRQEELAWDVGDARLKKPPTACTRRWSRCRRCALASSGEVRFGRWLRNWRVSVSALVEGVCGGISKRMQGRHVRVLEDTSENQLRGACRAHAGRMQGLGKDVGLFLHPVLAIDAQDHTCLGRTAARLARSGCGPSMCVRMP